MINVVIGAGIGGLSTGSITRKDGKYLVTALAVEAEPAIAKTHQLNHPHIPIVEMRVQNTKQTLELVNRYVPRRFWKKAWVHASNSCKLASTANFALRNL